MLVKTIVNQIRAAGGRFLEKLERDKDLWLEVSEKVAREKVSHALRDKHPLSTLTDTMSKLTRRLADPNHKTDDKHFIAANERLLRAHLPDNEHAKDDAVEHILTAEIESIRPNEAILDPVLSLFVEEHPHVLISSPNSVPRRPKQVSARQDINQDSHGRWDGLVCASRSDESFGRCFSSLDQKTNDVFWNLSTTFEPSLVPSNVVLGDDRVYDVLHFDDDDDDDDSAHEVVADWNNDGDLPHDFTADDCENLVAMLDVASSLA